MHADTAGRDRRRRRRARLLAAALGIVAVLGFVVGWLARGAVGGDAREVAIASTTAPVDLAHAIGATGCPTPRSITRLGGAARRVAITFDDGPSADTTPKILAILRSKGVGATFFETGEHSVAHPDLVAAVSAAGHDLGSHSWSHVDLSRLAPQAGRDEMRRSTQAVSAAAGTRVCLARHPFGRSTPALDRATAAEGLTHVAWTQNPQDWTNPTPARLRADSAPWSDSPPTILLLHEHGREDPQQVGPSATVAALPGIIDDYRARGYTFVRVDGTPFPAFPPSESAGSKPNVASERP